MEDQKRAIDLKNITDGLREASQILAKKEMEGFLLRGNPKTTESMTRSFQHIYLRGAYSSAKNIVEQCDDEGEEAYYLAELLVEATSVLLKELGYAILGIRSTDDPEKN